MEHLESHLSTHESVIALENVSKSFKVGKNRIGALSGLSLNVKSCDFLLIFGPSGCGKSTLLNVITGADEPTEGLAPLLVEQVGGLLAEIAARGVSILLVEQKLTIALKISKRLYVMGHGQIVFEGTPADLAANTSIRQEWLEV